MPEFTSWIPLTKQNTKNELPTCAAALELKTADELIEYPGGISSIVAYLYFSENTRAQFLEQFNHWASMAQRWGPLRFRYLNHPNSRNILERRIGRFVDRFGVAPVGNQKPTE